ncbi:MAG TPA: DR2241 family protein [Chthoniobacterales bacterium]|nr:DR2241 family protein [Chthoniobacterales bacterium]
MSPSVQETALANWLAAGLRCIGQISIDQQKGAAFVLTHRDDTSRNGLLHYERAEDAIEIARFDDAGNYRPLKTAPNLRRGWRLVLQDVAALRIALDSFYPGRLAAFFAWGQAALTATPLRNTLERQTGMYRASAKISDDEADALVGNFCRSDGGCLRTILWKRDESGAVASTRLPAEKFDPRHDQTSLGAPVIPLLCPEACNLLVAEARKIVRDFA